MTLRIACAGLALLAAASGPARADGCDALAAKLIRETGASFAGRSGPLVVFRAADAERMSLVCGPGEMVFRARHRQPNRSYFVLIGLAARGLTGAVPEEAETLALNLHQQTLLTGAPQQGRAGPAELRCEPGDRLDGLTNGTLCVLTPAGATVLRRRAGLPAGTRAG